MATGKEIRKHIASFRSTQKITKAMQLVAASKIRKAQQRMRASMPYAEKVLKIISHVAISHPEYRHPFLRIHDQIKRVGYIVISSDRGLCGGLNANLFRYLLVNDFAEWKQKNVDIDLCLIGNRASTFFKRLDLNIVAHTEKVSGLDSVVVSNIVGAVRAMLELYEKEEMDALYVVYNEYINTMVQKPNVQQLLPLAVENDAETPKYWDYIYEPSSKILLNTLLRRYLESQIYQAIVDNIACEEAARMVAMKSATDNAEELVGELQLAYNKTRQAAITQEIAEIVGGAAAV